MHWKSDPSPIADGSPPKKLESTTDVQGRSSSFTPSSSHQETSRNPNPVASSDWLLYFFKLSLALLARGEAPCKSLLPTDEPTSRRAEVRLPRVSLRFRGTLAGLRCIDFLPILRIRSMRKLHQKKSVYHIYIYIYVTYIYIYILIYCLFKKHFFRGQTRSPIISLALEKVDPHPKAWPAGHQKRHKL